MPPTTVLPNKFRTSYERAALVLVLAVAIASDTLAGPKVVVSKLGQQGPGTAPMVISSLPLAAIENLGASLVEDYENMAVVDLRSTTAEALVQATGLSVSPLPDHDKISLRHYTLDSTGGLPTGVAVAPFPVNQPNLYLAVLRSMPKSEWLAKLAEGGARVVAYVPDNCYLVWATGAALKVIQTRNSFLINVIPFAPAFRLDIDLAAEHEGLAYVVVKALSQAAESLATEVRAASMPGTFGSATEDPFVDVWGLVPTETAASLASQPEVITITSMSALTLSGEREGLIASGQVNGSAPYAPTCGAHYYSWLQSKGLAAAPDIQLALLDTGVDTGNEGGSDIHPDLKDGSGVSRIVHNRDYSGLNNTSDCSGHGTLVSSVMAGAGGVSPYNTTWSEGTDCSSGTFYSGLGIAPSARISSAKIWIDRNPPGGSFPPTDAVIDSVFNDLSAWGVWAANLSSNEPSTPNYTHLCEMLDKKVRNASTISPPTYPQIAVVVSAGNSGSAPVLPPATAKNVIAVGGSETYNRYLGDTYCDTTQVADNTHDVWTLTSYGFTTDGRIKPELVAPATRVMGAQTRATMGGNCSWNMLCPPSPTALMGTAGVNGIAWSHGTSFAAPQVTAAAGLAAKWFKTNHGPNLASPAMMKAMLVNWAADIWDGHFGATQVGHIPSHYQGWGKLDLTRGFPAVTTPGNHYVLDQTRLFTVYQAWLDVFKAIDPAKPVRVTLVWTDKEATGGTNGKVLLNDLDLKVTDFVTMFEGNQFDSGGTSHPYPYGSVPVDSTNNLEQVIFVPNNSSVGSGNFVVIVDPRVIAVKAVPNQPGTANQDFALFIDNVCEVQQGGNC